MHQRAERDIYIYTLRKGGGELDRATGSTTSSIAASEKLRWRKTLENAYGGVRGREWEKLSRWGWWEVTTKSKKKRAVNNLVTGLECQRIERGPINQKK
jgi:hypothetical protein